MFRSRSSKWCVWLLLVALLVPPQAEARRRSSSSQRRELIQLIVGLMLGNTDIASINPFGQFNNRGQFAFDPFFDNRLRLDPTLGRFNAFGNAPVGFGTHLATGQSDPTISAFTGQRIVPGFPGFGPQGLSPQLAQAGFSPNFAGGFGGGFGLPLGSAARFLNPLDPFAGVQGSRLRGNPILGHSSGQEQSLRAVGGGDFCGDKSYDAICAKESARGSIDPLVGDKMDRKLSKIAKPGDEQKFKAIMDTITHTGHVPPEARAWYDKYLESTLGGYEIPQEFKAQLKASMVEALRTKGYPEDDMAEAERRIMTATIADKPNVEDPEEMEHFLAFCKANNRSITGSACPFPHNGKPAHIFICGGMKEAALLRAGGDSNMALAGLGKVILHELGHLVGTPNGNSDPSRTMRACFLEDSELVQDKFRDQKLEELFADARAAEAMAVNIAQGNTHGLDAREYVTRSLEDLCGVPADDVHVSDQKRFDLFVKTLRTDPIAGKQLGCPAMLPGETVCTMQGKKGSDI